jgi:protein-L-isoaspartate(D-aspartate) O-methyltransferase
MNAGSDSGAPPGNRISIDGCPVTDIGGGSGAGAAGARPEPLAAARAKLADQLRTAGRAGPAVEAGFRAVPRHVFLPQVHPAEAYQDAAVVIKSDADGLPVSAATQPAMMAIMLDQLGLAAGHRVLEIGTGTGYNAALIAHLVGDQGSVVSIDVDAELIGHARASLAAAGYGGITLACGDGAMGVPDHAPYDRIIVTAGAWDLPPQWLAQLAPGGRIVLPLSVRGIQLAAALERAGDRWVSTSACRCGFIRMAGAFAGPESVLALGPQPGLHAQAVDGPVPEAGALLEALSGPVAAQPTGLRGTAIAELAKLDLWLTLTERRLTRLHLMGRHEKRAGPEQQRIASLLPLGGLADVSGPAGLGVASVAAAGGLTQPAPFGIVVQGYGPGGASLAAQLADQAAVWDKAGRPGVEHLELSAYPAGTAFEAPGGESIVFDRPHARLAVRWQLR